MKLISLFLFALSISTHATPESDPLTKRLIELVNINSGSANFKGVTEVQNKIKPWLEELGFKTEFKANPDGEKTSAPMLIATLAGEKPETITFIMHADTVFEPSSPFQKAEMKNEHTLRGPGVIDNKGGMIVALEGLKRYLAASPGKKPKYTLRVEVTPNEEVGAIGFHETFGEMSKDSFMALGFEPSVKQGIVEGRKGNVWFLIEVKGKEAHAGVHHEIGVNACHILSSKIAELQKLTDYRRMVTVSVGRIEGGQDKYNIVCGWAQAKMDTRVPNPKARELLRKKIEKILKDLRITVTVTDQTEPLAVNLASRPMIKKYLETIKKVEGKNVQSYFTGGVGDVNHFSREGIVIMDGLGPIGDGMHTPEEWVDVRSLSSRAKVLSEFLLGL